MGVDSVIVECGCYQDEEKLGRFAVEAAQKLCVGGDVGGDHGRGGGAIAAPDLVQLTDGGGGGGGVQWTHPQL